MTSTALINFSKVTTTVAVNVELIDMLRESRALWEPVDEMRYEKYGKIPGRGRTLQLIATKHLKARGIIK